MSLKTYTIYVKSCTKNDSGYTCKNDDIEDDNKFDLPAMTSSKNADLSGFEALLEEKYPGNWS